MAGKKILHLNSLGKDALATLAWLHFNTSCEVVSVYFEFEAAYPTDAKYWSYLQASFPRVKFVKVLGITEMNEKMQGMFQSPLWINYVMNNQEYESFDFKTVCEELRVANHCDYICSGVSKYEGMGRAIMLRRKGLLHEDTNTIYPIGLLDQKQIFAILSKLPMRLNPSYRIHPESHDSATYFKMRSAFLAKPEYKRTMYREYPMLALDEYRFEVLFKGKMGDQGK